MSNDIQFKYATDESVNDAFMNRSRDALLQDNTFIGKQVTASVNPNTGNPILLVKDVMNRSANYKGNTPISTCTPGVTGWKESIVEVDDETAAQSMVESIVGDKVEDTINPYKHHVDLYNPVSDINDSNNFVIMSDSAADLIDQFVPNIDGFRRDFDDLKSVMATADHDDREFIDMNQHISLYYSQLNNIKNRMVKEYGLENAKQLSGREFIDKIIKEYGHIVPPTEIVEYEKSLKALGNIVERKKVRENNIHQYGYDVLNANTGGIAEYAKIEEFEQGKGDVKPIESNGTNTTSIQFDAKDLIF